MNVVIIGGFGFVGRNIYEILIEDSTIDSVARLSKQNGFNLLISDFFDNQEKMIQDADFIINCAADVGSLNYVTEKAAEIIDINSRINLNLYSLLKRLKTKAKVINPIANCGYPGNLELYREEDFWNGAIHKSVLSFGETRRFLTVIAECYQKQFGIKSINYYVPNMYGEYDSTNPNKAHALNALISKIVEAKNTDKKEIIVWGTGEPIREWLYAKDFGRVVLETMIRYKNGEHFKETINVGKNKGFSINALLNVIAPAIGFYGRIIHDLSRQDGTLKKVMDNRKFMQRFPDFKFTTLENGVINTIKYYNSVYPYKQGRRK